MDDSILGGTAALKVPFRNPPSFRSSLFLCLGRASAGCARAVVLSVA